MSNEEEKQNFLSKACPKGFKRPVRENTEIMQLKEKKILVQLKNLMIWKKVEIIYIYKIVKMEIESKNI